MLANISRPS